MWDFVEGEVGIYSELNCFQSFLCPGFVPMLSAPHAGTKPCESWCWSQAGLCAAGRTWDTICQALAVSAELLFTTDWLLDCVFLTLSRTYLLFWSDLSPQGLALFHLRRSQAALPLLFSFLGGLYGCSLKECMEVMCSLTLLSVLPLSLENRSAAARLVVLSHTQMFPFIIHPEQS